MRLLSLFPSFCFFFVFVSFGGPEVFEVFFEALDLPAPDLVDLCDVVDRLDDLVDTDPDSSSVSLPLPLPLGFCGFSFYSLSLAGP